LQYTIIYRILYRMKVTAILPDELVFEVKELAEGRTITEGLLIALKEWTAMQRLKALNAEVSDKPLEFNDNFDPQDNRERNRRR